MSRRAGSLSGKLCGCCVVATTLLGCSEDFWLGKQRYLTAHQTMGPVYPRNDYTDDPFYLLHVNQLRELRRPSSLTYLGSDVAFHYFRVWNKARREGEVQFVALRKADCDVTGEAAIDSEVAYVRTIFPSHDWRHAIVDKETCMVGPRLEKRPRSVTSGK